MQAGFAIRSSSFLWFAISSTDELKFFRHAAKWPGEEARPDRSCPVSRDLYAALAFSFPLQHEQYGSLSIHRSPRARRGKGPFGDQLPPH